MRRGFIATSILCLASCSPSQQKEAAVEQPRSAFEFRGLRVGATLSAAKLSSIVDQCSDFTDYIMCKLTKQEIGEVPILQSYVDFTDNKFESLMVDVHNDWFEQLLANVRSAYGEPCRTNSKELQNAFGATFSGDEIIWCFSDGELIVRRHNREDFKESGLVFRRFEEEVPPKTFTANTL